jgi:hypothetical protein
MASQRRTTVVGKRSVFTLGFLLAGAVVAACGSNADITDDDGASGGKSGSGGKGTQTGTGGGVILGSGGKGGGSSSGGGSSTGGSSSGGGHTVQGGATFGGEVDYPDDITFDYEGGEGGTSSCASVTGAPQGVSRPIDIIFVIDNSGSMSEEIQEVEENIYSNFATIIQNATVGGNPIDYRVIMISRYGDSGTDGIENSDTNYGVCIPSPFGVQKSTGPNFDNDCSDPLRTPLRAPADQPADRRFFHYSADIESRDALCAVLESYDAPDEFNDNSTTNDGPTGSAYRNWIRQTTIPNSSQTGWQNWLRPEAFKTFVVITDDRIECNRSNFGGPNQAFEDNNDSNAQTAAKYFYSALL